MKAVRELERFSNSKLSALFEAVDIDDVVDAQVSLPDRIDPYCSYDEMRQCFAICYQFWNEGFDRADLLALVTRLLKTGDLTAEKRLEYKYIRAKYKHLRFATVLYDQQHKVPKLFSFTVAIMGQLQDAFRNKQRSAVIGYSLLLKLLLSKAVWKRVQRKLLSIKIDSAEGFLAYRRDEILQLNAALQQPELSGHAFHNVRKIISRQVSFYDTRRSLNPNEHDYKMSRFLSAINGLMGDRHDIMVEQAALGTRAYQTPEPLDPDIRMRIEQFVEAYPLAPAHTHSNSN